jgi:hypothetical protein
MKKYFLILTFAIFTNTYAQYNNSVSVSGGFVQENSYGGLINYNYNSKNSNYEIGVLHSMFKQSVNSSVDLDFSDTSIQLGYLHSIIRSRNNAISINFGAGVFGGYESVKGNDEIILKSKNGPIAGVYGVGQLDFYTSDNFAFVLRAQENYLFKTLNTGKMNPYFGFGLKFNF